MKFVLPILMLSLCFYANAQASLQYSRVKINLQTCSAEQIAKLGLEVDHGVFAPGKSLINDYSSDEISLLTANSITHEILIDDVKQWYKDQNKPEHQHQHHQKIGTSCGNNTTYAYTTPVNYQYGSMGGYLTYSQLLVELDKMTTLYPNLISPRTVIDSSVLTHEGRPIYYLRLSDNPNTDETTEPEVLYSALHHSREPNSLSQMVFYMWYLLENYATDTEIQYLVNETEMYFVPCVNPDGYVYNEQTDPTGGGLWRKNRKSTAGNVHGVDLNRNYGYEWGHDNSGSSPNMSSETYRGDAGFSEPETQNMKILCDAHDFKIAMNYHCYGNLLIYPWGYNDQPTADHQIFVAMADAMTRENNFFAGLGGTTVGYAVNGDSDDWMYGETVSKPAIFSMTPEVGPSSYGFWPPQSAIDELNKSCVFQNLTTAHLLLNYGIVREANAQTTVDALSGDLELEVEKLGLMNGGLTLEVTPLSSNFLVNTGSQTINLPAWTKDTILFNYTLDNTVVVGDSIVFLVELDNGQVTFSDTIAKIYSPNLNQVYLEDGNDVSEWQATGPWGNTTEEFVSPSQSVTDSPFANYSNGRLDYLTLTTTIDLTNAVYAQATFFAKWDIESNYDYVQFQAAPVGGSYTSLCGLYTETGQNTQPLEPVYDGLQTDWVKEVISLEDYLGSQVEFRFKFRSDNFVNGDGFYFDDLMIHTIDQPISTGTEKLLELSTLTLQPNPVTNLLTISADKLATKDADITIYNGLGQVVFNQSFSSFSKHQLDVSNWLGGLYLVACKSGNQILVEKLLVH